MGRHQPQSVQVTPEQLANRGEQLGSYSEVDCFRVEFRHRALVKCLAPSEALHLADEGIIRPAVGGAHPHVSATVQSRPREVVWTRRTRKYLYRHHVRLAVGQDLEIR